MFKTNKIQGEKSHFYPCLPSASFLSSGPNTTTVCSFLYILLEFMQKQANTNIYSYFPLLFLTQKMDLRTLSILVQKEQLCSCL